MVKWNIAHNTHPRQAGFCFIRIIIVGIRIDGCVDVRGEVGVRMERARDHVGREPDGQDLTMLIRQCGRWSYKTMYNSVGEDPRSLDTPVGYARAAEPVLMVGIGPSLKKFLDLHATLVSE